MCTAFSVRFAQFQHGNNLMTKNDLAGKRFGRLVVVSFRGVQKGNRMWQCQCDCGSTVVKTTHRLMHGKVKSCGCISAEILHARNHRHGFRHTPIYKIWEAMVRRCHNKNDSKFRRYGGRGIQVCEQWRCSAEAFCRWAIDAGYKQGLQIDRIDNDGHYTPENCRFVPGKINSRNRCTTRWVDYGDSRKSVTEWSEITGIKVGTILYRLNHNWTCAEALGFEVRSR